LCFATASPAKFDEAMCVSFLVGFPRFKTTDAVGMSPSAKALGRELEPLPVDEVENHAIQVSLSDLEERLKLELLR